MRDDEAGSLLAPVPELRRQECWWLVRRDGTPVAGDSGGVLEVLEELRLTRPVGRLLQRAGATSLVDAIYKRVARNRSTLGRVVPNGPAPRRFP